MAITGLFFAGFIIGFFLRRRRGLKDTVTIPLDTFQYLVERDDELWLIEKTERSKLRFVDKTLIKNCDDLIKGKTPGFHN